MLLEASGHGHAEAHLNHCRGVCPWTPRGMGLLALHVDQPFTWIKSKSISPWGACSGCRLRPGYCSSPAQEWQEASSLLSIDRLCNPSSESGATPEKQRKPHGTWAFLGAPGRTPDRTTSAGSKWPGTLRGARKETDLLPPLLFCTQGNLYSWSDTRRWPRARRKKTLLKRSKSTEWGVKRGKRPSFPGDCSGLSREKPCGDSSHEHVIIAWRGKVVRIWPGKKFRAESKPGVRDQSHSNRDQPGDSRAAQRAGWGYQAQPNTYPGLPAPNGPKGSNLAPGGTAPGGSRPGIPDDGSMPGCGKPDRRGSTIIPPLRPLGSGKTEKEMRLALVREEQSASLCQTSAAGMLSTGMWD